MITVYNDEAFLREAVESALAQTYAPLEVIVVDDGSTDGTAAVARSLPVVYLRQEHQGVSAARNTAIARARGDLFALLDADDVWLPAKLSAQLEALAADPSAGYALCLFRYVFHPPETVPDWFPPPWFRAETIPETEPGYCIPSCWLLRRSVWEQVGPFDVARPYAEDVDWLARARDLGVTTAMVDAPLVEKRIHAHNLSATMPSAPRVWLDALRGSVARKRSLRP